MAFNRKNLSGNVGAGSGGLQTYTFTDNDSTKAQIKAANYFLKIKDILKKNDTITCGGSDGVVILAVATSIDTSVTTVQISA